MIPDRRPKDTLCELLVCDTQRALRVGLIFAAHAGQSLARAHLRPHPAAVQVLKAARRVLDGKGNTQEIKDAMRRLDQATNKVDAHIFHERAVRRAASAVANKEKGNRLCTSLNGVSSYAIVTALVSGGCDESGSAAARSEEDWQRSILEAEAEKSLQAQNETRSRLSLLAS